MKHAILILAHKNIGLLCRLAGYFEKDCDVFIHIDKKQPVTREEEEKLRSYKQVKAVSREYDVNWGGTSVLESEMHLLRMAVQRGDADYFHLISGQDYPTRPLDYFLEFFNRNAGKNTSDTCICRILTGKTILSADCNIIIHTTMPQAKGIRVGGSGNR